MFKILQNLMKTITVVICFAISTAITVYSQTNKYGIYFVTNDHNNTDLYESPFKIATTNGKIIAKSSKIDTIIVVDLITPTKHDIFIETVIDGKNGFYRWIGAYIGNKDKSMIKLLKESKTKREDRLHQAYEYDKLKRDWIVKEQKEFAENTIKVDIYDTSLSKIGETSFDNPAIIYSYAYEYDESNQKGNFYYKAVWNNQDVIINADRILPFGNSAEMFIGENVRRKRALEQYKIMRKNKEQEAQNKERRKEEEERKKEEMQKRKEADRSLVESYNFKLVKLEQEIGNRTNQALPKINTQPIGTLTSAKGWTLCEDGQWASAQNKLPTISASTSPSMENFGYSSLGYDNFYSINLYKFTYGEQEYLLLVKKYKDGAFEYPSINKGWWTYTKSVYYVFDKSELDQLSSIKDGEPTIVKIKIKVSNTIFGAEATLEGIAKDIVAKADDDEKYSSLKRYKNLNLIINTDKTKNKIQFLLKENSLTKQSNSDKLVESKPDKIKMDGFKGGYYEMKYDLFSKFMKLP